MKPLQDTEEYTVYYDCNNCGNSYRISEVPLDEKCTCGTKLVVNKVMNDWKSDET